VGGPLLAGGQATDLRTDVRLSPVDESTPRALWHLFETVHAVTYFAPQSHRAAADLGLEGFWAGYVVLRSAPLGRVSPAVVTAAFHGFAPRRIEKVLPAAWDLVRPEEAVEVRARAAGAALRALQPDEDAALAAADAVEAAAARADTAGRVLAAANAALPRREDPYERLWQATTTLREHRGDGHVAALVAADVSPVESHLLKIAAGESPEESLRLGRAWDEEHWLAGARRLRERGWTDVARALTDAGRAARDERERSTDVAASGPWQAIGETATARVATLLRPFADAVATSGVVPFPNPVGLTWPPPAGAVRTNR
jgi:hypothetical protein